MATLAKIYKAGDHPDFGNKKEEMGVLMTKAKIGKEDLIVHTAYCANSINGIKRIFSKPMEDDDLQTQRALIDMDVPAKTKILHEVVLNFDGVQIKKGVDSITADKYAALCLELTSLNAITAPRVARILSCNKWQAREIVDKLVRDEIIEPYQSYWRMSKEKRIYFRMKYANERPIQKDVAQVAREIQVEGKKVRGMELAAPVRPKSAYKLPDWVDRRLVTSGADEHMRAALTFEECETIREELENIIEPLRKRDPKKGSEKAYTQFEKKIKEQVDKYIAKLVGDEKEK